MAKNITFHIYIQIKSQLDERLHHSQLSSSSSKSKA